jgi:hypothetical protein
VVFRLVTAPRDGGKSSYLRELARLTGSAGFLSPKRFGADGVVGYDILTLPSGERRPLARLATPAQHKRLGDLQYERPSGSEGETPGPARRSRWFGFRRFYFDQDAFDWALLTARELAGRGGGPLILDELGPLEDQGGGLYEVFLLFLETGRELTVSCRPALVERFAGLADPGRATKLIELGP